MLNAFVCADGARRRRVRRSWDKRACEGKVRVSKVKRGAAVLAVWLLAAGLAHAGPGKEMYEEFAKQGALLDDPRWQAYVQAIGDRLLAVSSHPNEKIIFYVVDSAQVNAGALPGYVFVYRGLLTFVESEDQLASVIGHEIGHVLARHYEQRRNSQALGKVTGFVAAVLTGVGQMMDTANAVTGMLVSGYGREAELEADRIGGELIAKAGYNPYAVIEMVQVLKDQELFEKSISGGRQTYHGLFATHPKNDKRLHEAVQVSYRYVPSETVEPLEDMWEMLDGLVYGDEAAEGIVKDQTFYNSSVRLVVTFPAGWVVTNSRTQVSGQAPGGKAQGEITIAQQAQVKGQKPAEYVKKTLKRDDVTKGESLKVNDFDAYIGELDVADGKSSAAMIAVVYKDGAVYFFKGSAEPGADAEAFKRDFRATVESFRAMTKEDVAIANRQRIKVIHATPKDSYRSLAKRSSIKSYPVETLRLLNGDFPNGEPRAGDRIKTVE